MNIEYCVDCDDATGKGGVSDGSLYLDDGQGPLCERCYGYHTCEQVEAENKQLRIELANAHEIICDEFCSLHHTEGCEHRMSIINSWE